MPAVFTLLSLAGPVISKEKEDSMVIVVGLLMPSTYGAVSVSIINPYSHLI